MSLLGCLVITEGYIVAYLATNLQKESYTILVWRIQSRHTVTSGVLIALPDSRALFNRIVNPEEFMTRWFSSSRYRLSITPDSRGEVNQSLGLSSSKVLMRGLRRLFV